jgi:tetratricopeptide (TPR) repeat protein
LTHQDDTQPKAPPGLRESIVDPLADTGPHYATQPVEPGNSLWRMLTMLGAVVVASCLCISIIALFGAAGVRDEMNAVGTRVVNTQDAELATQFALGNNDLDAGRLEMAEIRFSFIETARPGYQNAGAQLTNVQQIMAYTPTPRPVAVTESPLPVPSATSDATPAQTETPSGPLNLDPAQLFGRAETAMNQAEYEEAIRWFEALVLVDSNYRRAEVQELRLRAYTTQGLIYLRGQNADGEDRLAQGVQLVSRASEIGQVSPQLLYEADFVARYLAGRAYVEGGAFGQAIEVLTRLCEEDCDWDYQGLSVRNLLARAGGSAP